MGTGVVDVWRGLAKRTGRGRRLHSCAAALLLVAVVLALCTYHYGDAANAMSGALLRLEASNALRAGEHDKAVDLYLELQRRYPADPSLAARAGLAQYHAGRHVDALVAFSLLRGERLPDEEARQVELAARDVMVKLRLRAE